MVGSDFFSLFKDFQHVTQQIEIGKKLVQLPAGLDGPKQTGQKQMTSGSEAKVITFEGSNRKVTLEEGWNSVTFNVVCKNGDRYTIHEQEHACILQHETGDKRIFLFRSQFPLGTKVTALKPELLMIKMEDDSRTKSEVTHTLKTVAESTKKAEVQFTCKKEFCDVMLNHLDDRIFRLITSVGVKLFYYHKNNSFIVQIVGPEHCSMFRELSCVTKQIEIGKKVVELSTSIDDWKHDIDEKSLQPESVERTISFPQNTLANLNTLGVFQNMSMPFKYDFKILKDGIRFSCEQNSQLDELVKEFGVYVSRLRQIPVDFPVAAGALFMKDNKKRDTFLKQKLKCSEFKFIADNSGRVMMLCLSNDACDTIRQALSNCYHHTTIPQEILDQPMIQHYLKENADDVCLCNGNMTPNVTYLYVMQYVEMRVKRMNIAFLPVESLCFLTNVNENRDMFLKQHLKCEHLTFVVADRGIVLLCITKADNQTIIKSLRDIVYQIDVQSEKLEQPTVQQFLNDNSDDIFVCKDIMRPNVTSLYLMNYVWKRLTNVLNQYGNRCDILVSEYLKSPPGCNLLSKLEQEHKVKAVLSDRYIEFSGVHEAGSHVMNKLESCLHTVVHHELEAEKCKQLVCSNDVRHKIKQIADINSCSLKTIYAKIEDPPFGIHKVEGATYMATWVFRNLTDCVSTVCGDFKHMDGLIVFVNSSFYGEDPFSQDGNLGPLKIQNDKKQLGDIVAFLHKSHHRNILAVCVSDRKIVKEDETKSSLQGLKFQDAMRTCYNYFKKEQNIGVSIPMNEEEFSIEITDIIRPFREFANEEQFGDSHLHLCVKSNVEKWLQKANKSLLRECERRIVYPVIDGMFSVREDVELKIAAQSLLDIQAECLVVSSGKSLNLSEGIVAKIVNKEAGPMLQDELTKTYTSPLKRGAVVAAKPWNLSEKGVKLLLFVVVPHWKGCQKSVEIIVQLVNKCLLMADQYYCKSVAFPVFGTGSLGYPIRDVASVMFDGIARYKKEAMLQNIFQIFISAPVIKNNTTTVKLLQAENRRRVDMEKEKNCQFGVYEFPCLVTKNADVKTVVVNENHSQHVVQGHYMKIQLYHDQSAMGCDLSLPQPLYKVPCGKTMESLKKCIEDVFKFCEDNCITGVVVSTCKVIHMSQYDQVQVIAETINSTIQIYPVDINPERVYKYLTNVVLVVSDEYVMDVEHHSVTVNQNSFWKSLVKTNHPISFTKEMYNVPKHCINTVIIGSSSEQAEDTRQAIIKALHTKTNLDKVDERLIEKPPVTVVETGSDHNHEMSVMGASSSLLHKKENVDTTSASGSVKEHSDDMKESETTKEKTLVGIQGNQVTEPPVGIQGDHDTEPLDGIQGAEDMDLSSFTDDSVSAVINPGITNFLKQSGDDFCTRWGDMVKSTYGISVQQKNGANMIAIGNLTNIIEFEDYLENRFPILDSGKDEMTVYEEYYQVPSPEAIKIDVPISQHDGQQILKIFSKEISAAKKNYSITNIKIEKNRISINCSPRMKYVIPDFFSSLKRKLLVEDIEKDVTVKTKTKSYKFPFEVAKCHFKCRNIDVYVLNEDIARSTVDSLVSSVNSRMNVSFGVAKAIAKIGGLPYKQELNKSINANGDMALTECRETNPGNLHCKHVLHVNCYFGCKVKEIDLPVLETIKTSVSNCLIKANSLDCCSIALPMLGTGDAGIPVDLCAQECFRAVNELRESKLIDIRFMDISHGHVGEFVNELVKGGSYIQSTMTVCSLDVKSKDTSMHICREIESTSAELAFVQIKGRKPASVENYKVSNTKIILSGCYSIETYVPLWHQDQFLFESAVSDTILSVLKEASEHSIRHLVIPTFDEYRENGQHAEIIAAAMVKSAINFCQQKENKLKDIYFTSSDSMMVRNMCSVMLDEILKHSK